MKRIVRLLLFMMIVSVFVPVYALDQTSIVTPPDNSNKVKVALMWINNSKATYSDEIDKKMMDNFNKVLTPYNIIPGQRYIALLNEKGITDIAMAERADILDVFKGDDIDYVLYVELQPFVRKERITFFTYGIDITATTPIKIIDIKGNKYLYNGKFTEFASDSSMIGGIGNKSVSMVALDKVLEKMNPVILARLPINKTN